jgi:hypothetical protein
MWYVDGVAVVLKLLTAKGLLQQLLGCWEAGVSVSEVINFRLGLVIIARWVCALEVVVCPTCTMTTTSMLRAAWLCVVWGWRW